MKLDYSILENNLNEEVSYQDFFSAFGYSNDEKIFFRYFDDKGKNEEKAGKPVADNMNKLKSVLDNLHYLNRDNRGIYFVVNGGGHKDLEVMKSGVMARAQFAEIDDLPFEEQIDKINEFPLEPSIIIRTQKSLHSYWLVRDGYMGPECKTKEDCKKNEFISNCFRNIQAKLAQHFHSDTSIKNESRVMRLYGFYHCKKEPVLVKLIKFNPELVYTQKELSAVLPDLENVKSSVSEKCNSVKDGELIGPGSRYNYGLSVLGSLMAKSRELLTNDLIVDAVLDKLQTDCIQDPPIDYEGYRNDYLRAAESFRATADSEAEADKNIDWSACRNAWLIANPGKQFNGEWEEAKAFYFMQEHIEAGAEEQFAETSEPEKDYTEFILDDFQKSDAPFKWLYKFTGLERAQKLMLLKEHAVNVGVSKSEFNRMVKAYASTNEEVINAVRKSNVSGLPALTLKDNYRLDNTGLSLDSARISNQPIQPIRILTDITLGTKRLEIAFVDRGKIITAMPKREEVSDSKKLIGLSNFGMDVHSQNASDLSSFLINCYRWNENILPHDMSVSKMGWTEENQFVPYIDNIVYSGGNDFVNLYNSITTSGEPEKSMNALKEIRAEKGFGAILIAASIASPILKFCCGLPFIVHTWGKSDIGKSVGMVAAASIWGNPKEYIKGMNSTKVSMELSLGFLQNLPFCLDELQVLIAQKKLSAEELIYMICAGRGKGRGKQNGGLQEVPTWCSVTLTNGEQPILNPNSMSGAINRVLEINCKEKLCKDLNNIASIVESNYGYIGKTVIDKLSSADIQEECKSMYNNFYKLLLENNTTSKQAIAAAMILTADSFASKYVFMDPENVLSIRSMIEFIKSNEEVDVCIRAFEYLKEKIMQNWTGLYIGEMENRPINMIGTISPDKDYVCIMPSVFNKWLEEMNYNSKMLCNWLNEKGYIKIDADQKHFKVLTSFPDSTRIRCIWIKRKVFE